VLPYRSPEGSTTSCVWRFLEMLWIAS